MKHPGPIAETSARAALMLTLVSAASVFAAGCGHESAASPKVAAPLVNAAPAALAETSVAEEEKPAEPAAAPAPVEVATNAAASTSEDPAKDAEPPRIKGQRPPADRTPAKPGEAEKITWDDLNIGMPADVVFRPFMISDRVKELEGKQISILGFIHGAATGGSKAKIKELILLKNTECKYGAQGQADHLAKVYFAEGKAASYTDKAIKVEGTLKIEPFTGTDGNTWSVFRLEDAVVK